MDEEYFFVKLVCFNQVCYMKKYSPLFIIFQISRNQTPLLASNMPILLNELLAPQVQKKSALIDKANDALKLVEQIAHPLANTRGNIKKSYNREVIFL